MAKTHVRYPKTMSLKEARDRAISKHGNVYDDKHARCQWHFTVKK